MFSSLQCNKANVTRPLCLLLPRYVSPEPHPQIECVPMFEAHYSYCLEKSKKSSKLVGGCFRSLCNPIWARRSQRGWWGVAGVVWSAAYGNVCCVKGGSQTIHKKWIFYWFERKGYYLVRVPNLYFGSRLGAQYPKNSKNFLWRLPQPSFGDALV